MEKESPKIRTTIKVEKEVWEQIGPILREIGYTKSAFINMMFKMVIQGQTRSYRDMMSDMVGEMMEQVPKKEWSRETIRLRKKEEQP